MRLSRLLKALAFASATGLAQAATTHLTIATADGPRHAIVVPVADGPQPTVLVLHGALGTAALTMRATGFAEAAKSHGFTAVFADGIDRRWNDGRRGGPGGADDIAFLTTLVERLVADHVARPDRVFVAGISNGGMMSFALACKAPQLFAGIGTIIANMPAGVASCSPKAMPVVMINGTADPMVPYRGGGVGFSGERGDVLGVDETLALFAKADGCGAPSTPRPLEHADARDATSTVRIDWQGCTPGTSLTLYRIDGGGHAIPGRPALFGGLLGPSTQDFVGADAILDAFAAAR